MATEYRIKHNSIKETLTDKVIEEFYSIEYKTRKYFGLFGPYVWKDYYIDVGSYIYEEGYSDSGPKLVFKKKILKFANLYEANVACIRLNENIGETYNYSRIVGGLIMENKYRIKHNLIRATVTEEIQRDYYSIEYRTRKYFGLFGPYVWKDYCVNVAFPVSSRLVLAKDILKFSTFDEANVACVRLNKKIGDTYNDSQVRECVCEH